ncbi:MAG: cytochrome o ubiquinol oxidase subunit IV [Pseudomonadota bacterium]
MSADAHTAGHGHGSHDGHDDHAHASYKSYLIGFGLSVVLTVIPFWMVLGEVTDSVPILISVIFGLGAIQILVHVYYFLHVTLGAEEGWQAMSIAFTTILVVIIMVGSIWVLFHLHENMMPAHEQIERVRNLP